MLFLIKFSIYFIISFTILSFPVEDKTLFEHTHNLSKPYTQEIFNHIKKQSKTIFKSTIEFSKNIFKNSTPKEVDRVRSGLSAVKKNNLPKKKKEKPFIYAKTKKPFDSYTPEEKNLLKNILSDSQK